MSVQSSSIAAAPLSDGRRTVRVTGSPSPRCCHTGGTAAQAAADFNNSTPVITEEYLAEVIVPFPTVVTGIAVFNGSDVTGNMTVALRDSTGNLLAKSASTAGSGTDDYQRIPFSTTYANNNGTTITGSGPLRIEAGTYYVAVQYSSATARYNTHHIGSFGTGKTTGGTYGTVLPTGSMPTTFTADIGNVASLY